MKQTQKNYLLARITQVQQQKQMEINSIPSPKLTKTEIKQIMRKAGVRVATFDELADAFLEGNGNIPYYTTRENNGSGVSIVKNTRAYTAAINERNATVNAARQKKSADLNTLVTKVKDKLILEDSCEEAMKLLADIQNFSV